MTDQPTPTEAVDTHTCPRCRQPYPRGSFYYLRVAGGAVCSRCVLDLTGYESIEDYQRGEYDRGSRSPREA